EAHADEARNICPSASRHLAGVRSGGYSSAMKSRRQPARDLDSPWKETLEHFLAPFLAFFFPEIHDGIDWSRGYQSLDKELQQILRGARVGRRLADKLFKVWRKDGQE